MGTHQCRAGPDEVGGLSHSLVLLLSACGAPVRPASGLTAGALSPGRCRCAAADTVRSLLDRVRRVRDAARRPRLRPRMQPGRRLRLRHRLVRRHRRARWATTGATPATTSWPVPSTPSSSPSAAPGAMSWADASSIPTPPPSWTTPPTARRSTSTTSSPSPQPGTSAPPRGVPAERASFANDPDLELIAVSGGANLSKGDSTPASWLPPLQAVPLRLRHRLPGGRARLRPRRHGRRRTGDRARCRSVVLRSHHRNSSETRVGHGRSARAGIGSPDDDVTRGVERITARSQG